MTTPTKKQLLKTAYQRVMDVSILNMKAPIRWIDQYVSESVTGFGTAADEKVRSIKDYHKLIQEARKQSKGIAYKAVVKTAYRPKMRGETQAVFNDEIVVSIGTKKNVHQITLWMSTVFQWADNKWQLILFHGSMPNFNTSSEDTFHIEDAKKRVKELEQKVAEKTAELKDRNRELEIETALEKVRAVAMGMRQADDMLRICKIISEQLTKLGVQEIRNVQTAIFNNRGTYMNYEYYAKHNKEIVTEVTYTGGGVHIEQKKFVQAMLGLGKEIYTKQFKGAQLGKWHNYQKGTNQLADKYLLKAHSLNYYWYSLGEVALGFSTYYPLSENELTLYKKFRNVFALAYKRYVDIEKATAQAREAQIELAVERVRAKALAMYNSSQILDVVNVLKDEMLGLKIAGVSAATIYLQDKDGDIRMWDLTSIKKAANGLEVTLDVKFKLEESDPQFYLRKIWNGKEKYFVVTQDARSVADSFKWLRKYKPIEAKAAEQFFKKHPIQNLFHPTVKLANGRMSVDIVNTTPALEMEPILLKMGAAFDLAYKRFLDLQKAEAQAREAEIQLALERVRARTMAMQKSEEFADASLVVFQQLSLLGVATSQVSIVLFDDKIQQAKIYLTVRGNRMEDSFTIDLEDEVIVMNKAKQAFQLGEKTFYITLAGKDLQKYNAWRNASLEKKLYDESAKVLKKEWHVFASFFSKGAISLSAESTINEDSKDLLIRFANAFDGTITRFLDLQKAEAQAREANIEAALERVRSKAMAMHTSKDILDTATTAFEELSKIGIYSIRCGVGLFNKTSVVAKVYAATKLKNGKIQTIEAERNTNEHASLRRQIKAWQEQKDLDEVLKGKELASYYNNAFFKEAAVKQKATIKNSTEFGYYFAFADGLFYSWTDKEYTLEEKKVLDRFRSIIALTFRRFLDLQKAEAQAREAQIQLALERVRARTMAMQKSDELAEVSYLLNKQVNELGIATRGCAFNIYNEHDSTEWFSNLEGTLPTYRTPRENIFQKYYEAGLRGEALLIEAYGKEKIRQHYDYLFSLGYFGNAGNKKKTLAKVMPESQIDHVAYFKYGYLLFITLTPVPEAHDIFKRFAKEFEQTYTRFLDLQKAEAQARDAQIEAALERVRSKAMAMHNSADLPSTAIIAFTELKKLGFVPIRCGISIQNKENRKNLLYSATTTEEGDNLSIVGWAILDNHPVLHEVYNKWLKGEDYFPELKGKLLKSYYEQVRNSFEVPIEQTQQEQYGYFMYFTQGVFYGWCEKPVTEEEKKLLRRFASVMDLTFKRYFDLQKAEASAREAQIEASLEKVRSVAMSMHHSNELLNICEAIYAELLKLGITELRNTMINIHNDADETFLNYDYSAYAGRAVTKYGYHIHPIINRLVMQCRSAQDAFVDVAFEGEAFEAWRSFRKSSGEKDDKRLNKITHLHYYFYSIGIGSIGVSTFESIDEQKLDLLKRFRNVFQLAYQRFTDLAAAEAQAREAQIEGALERVRSRTMAMQKSEQLLETAQVLFEQFAAFGKIPDRMSIGIVKEEKQLIEWWLTDQTGGQLTSHFDSSFNGPTISQYYVGWKEGKDSLVIELSGEPLKEWVAFVRDKVKLPIDESKMKGKRVHHAAFFSQGLLLITAHEQMPEETMKLLTRFAKVFSQTYTRFLDLQTAEAAAKEAIKQAALDRIRADIASMRTKEDLNRITPLIWNELTILGIPFIRCGVFMMDEAAAQIHTFLSTPTGEAIAAFHLSFEEFENIKSVVHHWRNKQAYINHWHSNEFAELADSLIAQGAIANKEQYLQSLPAEGIHLNFIPFLQGMLYVGNTGPLPADDIHLLQSVADAFATAYARYEDFNKLEAAKQVVEKTLEELKATQKQLVQSEKMASLGELTAGIAHEIQNPLNFVNNFSELNIELVEELIGNREKGIGDSSTETELLNDIKTNSEKINHHGKRADGIVKGMLQHSRSSTGQKEPTDINALCDEYLRLAYHGLRAKDKTFNAEFKTEFDETIGKVNVQPQEMGRVILNLINNAFYACTERSRSAAQMRDTSYEPRVTVKTSIIPNPANPQTRNIAIAISDNGTGIPQHIKEKIFQPFFTTKPTGQGTGLGLSLAYDIVTKGHGGKLEVDEGNPEQLGMESEKGKGTTFVVTIPMSP